MCHLVTQNLLHYYVFQLENIYNNCIYRTCGQVWGNLRIKNKLLTYTFILNMFVS